jgi:hypothetical protein
VLWVALELWETVLRRRVVHELGLESALREAGFLAQRQMVVLPGARVPHCKKTPSRQFLREVGRRGGVTPLLRLSFLLSFPLLL